MTAHYYSFSEYCKQKYGRKLYKAPLNANMTCPNRDGSIGSRGCIFCGEGGSGDFAVHYNGQLLTENDLAFNQKNNHEFGNYIAYFQSFTNTYAPIKRLELLYDNALSNPLFSGISIGTRPDCISDETISLFKSLSEKYPDKFIWVELGLQTIHESTANYIRRGYSLPTFDNCVTALKKINIPVITHIILGLPGEDKKKMLQTIEHLNLMKIDGIKLQLLHVIKGTDLCFDYENGVFNALSLDEYVDIICACISHLDKNTVIHRLTGDGNKSDLIAPLWSLDKRKVLNQINHSLAVNNIYQGDCLYS